MEKRELHGLLLIGIALLSIGVVSAEFPSEPQTLFEGGTLGDTKVVVPSTQLGEKTNEVAPTDGVDKEETGQKTAVVRGGECSNLGFKYIEDCCQKHPGKICLSEKGNKYFETRSEPEKTEIRNARIYCQLKEHKVLGKLARESIGIAYKNTNDCSAFYAQFTADKNTGLANIVPGLERIDKGVEVLYYGGGAEKEISIKGIGKEVTINGKKLMILDPEGLTVKGGKIQGKYKESGLFAGLARFFGAESKSGIDQWEKASCGEGKNWRSCSNELGVSFNVLSANENDFEFKIDPESGRSSITAKDKKIVIEFRDKSKREIEPGKSILITNVAFREENIQTGKDIVHQKTRYEVGKSTPHAAARGGTPLVGTTIGTEDKKLPMLNADIFYPIKKWWYGDHVKVEEID